MGQRHAEILRATPGAGLTCLQDRDRAFAEKVAKGESIEEDYNALLRRKDVDAVVLCLPSGLHAKFGIAAAEAGKHVITEKPIDIDVQAGGDFAEACRRNKVVCAVISQNRFADGVAALKQALDRGDLGEPVLISASVKWFRHDEYYTKSDWRGRVAGEGGGVLMNQAIHTMDLLLWMFGEPVDVCGMTHSSRNVLETEDVGAGMLRFKNGAIATLVASTSTYPGFDERLEVHSPVASCILEKGNIVFWKHARELPQPQPPQFDSPAGGLGPKFELFQRQYRNILAAIRGEEELIVTPEQSIGVVAATRAIYESQAERQSTSR